MLLRKRVLVLFNLIEGRSNLPTPGLDPFQAYPKLLEHIWGKIFFWSYSYFNANENELTFVTLQSQEYLSNRMIQPFDPFDLSQKNVN